MGTRYDVLDIVCGVIVVVSECLCALHSILLLIMQTQLYRTRYIALFTSYVLIKCMLTCALMYNHMHITFRW